MSFAFNTPIPSKNNKKSNPNNDVVLGNPPTDSIQSLKWSPTTNLLAAASWDCTVRCYSVDNSNGSSNQIGQYQNDGPVLDVEWQMDGSNVLSCGCDKLIKMWNPNQSTPSVVGYHDKPIKQICFCSDQNNNQSTPMIVSGGWDKLLKYWDIRQSVQYQKSMSSNNMQPGSTNIQTNNNISSYISKLKPIGTVTLPERVYSMDINYPLLCIALANKKVIIFDVRNPQKPMKEMVTLLKHQLRCISCFTDREGFAVGSVEGRTAIHYINGDAANNKKSFAFKCHRQKENVYAVNSIKFHKQCGTLATAGSDGSIYFWDKDKKQKLKEFASMNLPITDIDFNYDGTLLSYSISYDWSKGIEHFQPTKQKPEIYIHKIEPNEIMPKKDK